MRFCCYFDKLEQSGIKLNSVIKRLLQITQLFDLNSTAIN